MNLELTKEEIDMIYVLSEVYLSEHKDEWIEETPHIKIIKSLIEKFKNK
jgi:hypothetical protein